MMARFLVATAVCGGHEPANIPCRARDKVFVGAPLDGHEEIVQGMLRELLPGAILLEGDVESGPQAVRGAKGRPAAV